ncbi:MAG: methyltransferase domain-containing protein [Verrucomicrobia bacterium]|nr:methyltransferase domain-containing protein [Verrucomicrobiota bacterium]
MIENQDSCRFCQSPLKHSFCDLGMTPLSNSYLKKEQLEKGESFYPLHAYVCSQCFLVQVKEYELPQNIFSDYAYFSSYSDSWLKHCKNYAEQIITRLKLDSSKQVIEIASNDGYLLQFFKERNIPVLGIEPAANVAKVAQEKSIPTLVKFFGSQVAQELKEKKVQGDLLIGNNVLAHVPGLNDFVRGMQILLKPRGVITMEFPHLLRLMESNQFDTIYHEHFSYFSLVAVEKVFKAQGLKIFDVEELKTHGGSLRIYAAHEEDSEKQISQRVVNLKKKETELHFEDLKGYTQFSVGVQELKANLLRFFLDCKKEGKKIVGYGAPAKGNTLLNFCGIRSEFLNFTVDRSPHKQGQFLPGTHIPIYSVEEISKAKPDYLFVLPWNLKDEIINQMAFIREWGGKFVIPIPKLEILE